MSWMAKLCAGIAEGLLRLHKHLTFSVAPRTRPTDEFRRKSTSNTHMNDHSKSVDRDQPPSPIFLQNTRRRASNLATEQYGRHGDINPNNLLWYDNADENTTSLRGTLKLSDFGQAELHSQYSKRRRRSVANTMTYRPPECDLQPNIIRQSYDIWCLGCVYLEFVTWILGGEALSTTFGWKRKVLGIFHFKNEATDTFFQFVRSDNAEVAEVIIKPAVTKVRSRKHLLIVFVIIQTH
jgi:serine/threonine protein kinase